MWCAFEEYHQTLWNILKCFYDTPFIILQYDMSKVRTIFNQVDIGVFHQGKILTTSFTSYKIVLVYERYTFLSKQKNVYAFLHNRNMHQIRTLNLQEIPVWGDERYKFLKTITIDMEMHLNLCILCSENKTVKYMSY